MSVHAAQAALAARTNDEERRLRGAWLVAARMSWVVIALLTMIYCVISFPMEFARLRSVCTAPPCSVTALDSINLRELESIGGSVDFFATYVITVELVFAVVSFAVGSMLFWRKSDERMALFVALMLVTFGSLAFADSYDAVAAWAGGWWWAFATIFFLGNISPVLFFFLFPTGRFVPRWACAPAALLVVLGIGFHFFRSSPIFGWLTSIYGSVFSVSIVVLAVWAQFYRYRRVSDLLQRQQTKWVVWGTALAMLGSQSVQGLLPLLGRPHVLTIGAAYTILTGSILLIPLSIGVAIMRSRLWDIDVLITRTLVYGALSASVVGIYVVVVGYLSTLFQTSGNLAISLVATGLVAVLFQPLRDQLQRGVNRVLFGARDDPYAVLAHLGQQLDNTLDPDAVLPTIVATVRDALKLPYVAIILDQEGRAALAAATGHLVADPLSLPLFYQNEPAGQLLLGPRGPGEAFSAADRRLIEVLTRHVGVAAHAVRLTAALQRSREQLVLAREEERRRLRNDLHDGLGPQLAGLTMKIQTARLRLAHDPLADTLLAELAAHTQEAVADIRQVVYGLRPPSLDELGLLFALREAAAQYQVQGFTSIQIQIDTPDQLPLLPAAIEVATYRIAQEALTNAIKHAQAHTCWLQLAVDVQAGALVLTVQDDGHGITPEQVKGVGLRSMRERATELGGTLTVEPVAEGGTRVSARLPLPLSYLMNSSYVESETTESPFL